MDFIPSLRAWLVSFLNGIPSDDPASATLYLFLHGGWAVLLVVLLVTMVQLWLESRRDRYAAGVRWVLLAIDVPKETEQSPQAVEHVFSALAGTHLRGTLVDRWWHGKTQSYFSFEIVSLGGYTQFLVRTPVNFRDLVEASLYAQYPDAEVTEVEDYVGRIPLNFDTEEYDLWGTEFQLMKLDVYPIKTYPEFEHTLSQEFKDPMAGLLEILSRIKPDEDVWLQLVVTPTDDSWKNQAKKEVQRIISKKEGSGGLGGVLTSLLFQLPAKFLYTVTETVFSGVVEPGKSTVSTGTLEKKPHTVQELTPGEKDVVVAIERKASKIGFKTKFRLVYWGRRETFLKGR
ncbi:MAG: hypothetical protein U1C53_03010, partial [Candidatus Veblenbacteria bacterium]|nr:hypothetical protein [Candidatus Veblenbacteria bacterium]